MEPGDLKNPKGVQRTQNIIAVKDEENVTSNNKEGTFENSSRKNENNSVPDENKPEQSVDSTDRTPEETRESKAGQEDAVEIPGGEEKEATPVENSEEKSEKDAPAPGEAKTDSDDKEETEKQEDKGKEGKASEGEAKTSAKEKSTEAREKKKETPAMEQKEEQLDEQSVDSTDRTPEETKESKAGQEDAVEIPGGEEKEATPVENSEEKGEKDTPAPGEAKTDSDDKEETEKQEDEGKEVKEGKASEGEAKTSAKEKSTEAREKKKEDFVQKKDKKAASLKHKEKPDYSKYSQVELVNAMRDIIENDGDHNIKDDVEIIKAAFYKQLKEEIEQQRKKFIEEGGDEEDFKPIDNPYEKDIKDLLKRYRHIRTEFNKKLEQEKEVNLQLKYNVIKEIKGLINKEESINKTFQDFRDLQQRWREIGLVPQSKMKNLWDTYHFHVENFYDYIKINKELRDLDLKKNLEMKIKLCEQAEELLLETNIIQAFNALQKLHERWREIGPVPRENKDDIWERFKTSTAKINKKHQGYFENRKAEQKKNLEAKRALCEKVEEINELDLDSHKDWGEKSKEVINLQKIWRTIGFAPRKDNNHIYDRFRTACDSFFDAKRAFYAKNKELQQNNLQMKIDLCVQAEALKDSTDWRKTTHDFIDIQKQWKEIGPVPRKQSDVIWKRFRAACDHFFEKKSEHFSTIEAEQVENLKKKEQLIEDVQSFKSKGDVDENLNTLKDFQRRWTEIGHVPFKKKDTIQKEFRDAINKLFDDLNINESKRNLLKFRTKMASFSESSRGQNKMRLERDKYMNKLKQLENDLVLLDNNVGFFAKSKNAESLIEDVKRKIEQTREKIEFLKNKIRVIDEMDEEDE